MKYIKDKYAEITYVDTLFFLILYIIIASGRQYNSTGITLGILVGGSIKTFQIDNSSMRDTILKKINSPRRFKFVFITVL